MLSAAVLDSIYIIAKARQRTERNAVDFARSIGFNPDPWQGELLLCEDRNIQVNCSRQSGKTSTTGILAAHQAVTMEASHTVILAPGMRQGSILMRKIHGAYLRAGRPVKARVENALELILENDASVLVLPGNEATSRGPSGIDLLLVEEASRVPDDLYSAVLPMLATRPNAREMQMSTPFGTRGFFYERWKLIQEGKAPGWKYFEIPATKCPRIKAEFLEEMRRRIGEWWYLQEFCCKFLDAISSAFPRHLIDAAFSQPVEEWAL